MLAIFTADTDSTAETIALSTVPLSHQRAAKPLMKEATNATIVATMNTFTWRMSNCRRTNWPMVAAAFQLLCVSIHVARLLDPGVRAWAYATGQVIFTQLYLWTIAFAVWGTWRRRRQPVVAIDAAAIPGATRR